MRLSWSRFKTQHLSRCPALLDSIFQACRGDAHAPRPLRQPESFTLIGEQVGVIAITCLLGVRCPTAITRFVVTIIVDAVKCGSCWAFTHINKKILKFHPPIAHLNTPSAIPFKAARVYTGAPRNHTLPSFVFGLAESAVLTNSVPIVTPARSGVATFQGLSQYSSKPTAHAETIPEDRGHFGFGRQSQNQQSPEALSRQFSNGLWHTSIIPQQPVITGVLWQ